MDKIEDRNKLPGMPLSFLPESFKEEFCKEHEGYRIGFCANYLLKECPRSCYYAKETLKKEQLERKVQ